MMEKSVLPCGLTIISETIPHIPSFALSYSLKSGSRQETPQIGGMHHLIEHMLFKGSAHYDLKQIADLSDRLGGRLNAFTSKEITQFYIKSIDEKLPESFDLLSNIVLQATFPKEEFDKEKNVIVQEIKESADTPDTHAFEVFYETVYPQNGLGYPIGGKEEQVASLSRDQVLRYYRSRYLPGELVLGAAGGIKHQRLVELASASFSAFPAAPPRDFTFPNAVYRPQILTKSNSGLNQLYIILGYPAVAMASEQRYAFMIMNDILGGGMSSRLFQSIREEKGLAYTINSFVDSYLECGIHIVYAVIEPNQLEQYLEAAAAEIRMLKRQGITATELERSKDHIKSSLILGLESNTAKMRFLINQQLYLGHEESLSEIQARINGIQRQDIEGLLHGYLDGSALSLFVYGPTPEKISVPDFN